MGIKQQLAGGKESDKPIPYKRLYEECQVEIGQYQALIEREYIKKAGRSLLYALQEIALSIDTQLTSSQKAKSEGGS